jgi:DNA repair exonuclease SbcCD ATPase subunit
MIRLLLRNWYAHRQLEVDLETPVSFVVGPNGRGKTALRDAVEFVLLGTGELRGIETKKELAQLAILEGEDDCEVVLETPRVRLRRVMTKAADQRLWKANRAGPESDWEPDQVVPLRDQGALFDAHADVVRTGLEPTAFYRLAPSRRREILIAATSEGAPADQIAAAIDRHVSEAFRHVEAAGGDLTEEQATEIAASAEAMAKAAAEQGFEAARDLAVERRKQAKRDLEAIELHDVQGVYRDDLGTVDLAAHSLAEHEAHLEKIREARRKEAAGAGSIRGQLEEAERLYREVLAETSSPADEAAESVFQAATAAASEAAILARAAQDDLARLEQHLAELAGSLEDPIPTALEPPAQCPAMPAAARMPCPVKKTTFAKALAGASGGREAERAALDRAQAARNHAIDALTAARSASDAAASDLGAATERLAAEKARAAREADRHQRADDLEARLAQLTKAAQAEPQAPTGPSLEEREHRGTLIVAAKRRHDAALAARKAAEEARARAETAIRLWDAMAKALAPEGVASQLGGGAREAFEERLRAVEPLAGAVRLDEDFAIWVDVGEGPRHPLQLSESQRLALGVALQHGIAQLLHLPLLVVDAVDTFDLEHRASFLEIARAIAEEYPAGVLGLATSSAAPPAPPPEGVSTVWLRPDGRVQILGAEGF